MTHRLEPDTLLAQAGWLKGLARGLVLDDAQADDVVQQTWLRAIERPPREPRALPAWLAAVARNEARQAGRSEGARSRRQTRVARLEASVAPVDDVVARAELHRELVRRVLELPEPQRSTVLLRYFEGLEPSEIARRQDVPAGTVRSRLKRGLDALRADLDRECGGDRHAWVAALLPWVGQPDAAMATGVVTVGALAMSAKTKALVMMILVLALGGLLGWSLLGRGASELGDSEVGDRNDGRPVLRGRVGDEALRAVAPDERPDMQEEPAQVVHESGPRVALVFVDEDGRPWTVEELQDGYESSGLEPRLTFVREAQLGQEGLPGLLGTLLGSPDAWQVAVDLQWTPGGAMAVGPETGEWRVYVARPDAAPYLSGPRRLTVGEAVRLEVPFPRHPRRVTVRILDATTGAPLGGARVTPYYEVGDDMAFLRGPAREADAGGEVVLPVYDAKLSGKSRGPTWWIETVTHARALSNGHLMRHDEGVVLDWPVQPMAAATGHAWTSEGESAVGLEVVWARKGRIRRATVAEDGRYLLTGIAIRDGPKRDENLLLLEDVANGRVSRGRVAVRAGETAEADLGKPASPSTVTLVGRITAGGRPLEGVFVGARNGPGKGRLVQTDADGTYRVPGLDEGATEVRIHFGDPRVVDDFAARTKAPLQLDAGAQTRLDFALPEGAILLKVVRDVDGEPVAGGVGTAWPTNRGLESERFRGFTYQAGWGGRTGEDGTILLLALVPGHPHVLVAGGDGYEKLTQEVVQPGTVAEPLEVTVRLRAVDK